MGQPPVPQEPSLLPPRPATFPLIPVEDRAARRCRRAGLAPSQSPASACDAEVNGLAVLRAFELDIESLCYRLARDESGSHRVPLPAAWRPRQDSNLRRTV